VICRLIYSAGSSKWKNIMLVTDKKRFIQVPFDSEDEIENVVVENSTDIFGPDSVYFPKTLIKTSGGTGTIPDGFSPGKFPSHSGQRALSRVSFRLVSLPTLPASLRIRQPEEQVPRGRLRLEAEVLCNTGDQPLQVVCQNLIF
jgi:hypothetical protein